MKCHQARQLFFLYFDSELDPRSVQEVNLHLETCPACRALWSRETALEEAVGRAAWTVPGPAEDFPWEEFRERLRSGLPRLRRPWLRRGAAVFGIFGAAALLALGSWRFLSPEAPVDTAARSAVEHHEKFLAGKSPLQVRSQSAEAVRNFYAGELGFEVRIPDHFPPEEGTAPIRLLGARRCTFLGGPVAYISYEIDRRPVTAILGPLKPPAEILEAVSAAPDGVAEKVHGNYRSILSSVHGLLFHATGEASPQELRGFLEAFRRAAEKP